MLAPPPLPRTVEASFRDLGAARPEVRVSSIEDLARHATRDPSVRARAIPPLERALHDDVAGVRSAAAVALADLRAREALQGLLVAIEDPDGYVRQMALSALGEIGDRRAAPRLLRALTDARPEVRYQAIIAYVRVLAREPSDPHASSDAEEAKRALLAAMDDADESVRYIALRLVEERIDAGGEFSAALARIDAMLDASSKEPPHVSVVAAIVLAKGGRGDDSPANARRQDRARDRILRVVDGRFKLPSGPAREDEREAVELSGVLGMTEATPALERRAFGLKHHVADTCAYAATIALARMLHPRASAELLAGLRSRRRATCEAAVVAVGRARLLVARPIVAGLTGHDADPDFIARTLGQLDAAEPAFGGENRRGGEV